MSYTFKVKPSVKFHNGRDMTSQDVKYSYDAYANGDKNGNSASASSWLWYDSIQTPDPQTVVLKTKASFADAVLSRVAHTDATVCGQEFASMRPR